MTIPIGDYAESMFRFERLHPRWIDPCATYLRTIFGSAIEGAVFLDYAFGRGNWSVAALQAGAKRVVAVDAAEGNVRRFSDYCRASDIDGIEIIQGNALEAPLNQSADILWIYGILSSVAEPQALLTALAAERHDDRAIALLYGYDRGSLRHVIVDAARRDCLYKNEHEFAEDSFLFTPRARLRARDDLTAPIALWYGAAEFFELAVRGGFVPQQAFLDFGGWLNASALEEFAPHVLLCGFTGAPCGRPKEVVRPLAGDAAVLAGLMETVQEAADTAQRRSIAIGLFNTHFTSLTGSEPAASATIDDFLFLMHATLRLEISAEAIRTISRGYYHAALAAAVDAPRDFAAELIARSPLAKFLDANTVRF